LQFASAGLERMFKKEKDLAERSRSLLKNKETKKLKADVRAVTQSNISNVEISVSQWDRPFSHYEKLPCAACK
jgi:hypothetical protein